MKKTIAAVLLHLSYFCYQPSPDKSPLLICVVNLGVEDKHSQGWSQNLPKCVKGLAKARLRMMSAANEYCAGGECFHTYCGVHKRIMACRAPVPMWLSEGKGWPPSCSAAALGLVWMLAFLPIAVTFVFETLQGKWLMK